MSTPKHFDIDLERLKDGTPCLSPATTADLVESAAVCLVNSQHQSGVPLELRGRPASATLRFAAPDARAFGSRNDSQQATERAAVAVAIALVREALEFEVVEQAEKRTGCDWMLGDDDDLPFQNKARLEVSGILREDSAKLNRRVRQKRQQLQRGENPLPGYVVVVGFARPVAVLEEP